jgi:hypothetical protein
MDQPTPSAPIHPHHHSVKFYGNSNSLVTTVAGFLSEGLVTGQPALIIATPVHRALILDQLAARLIDVERAKASGDLLALDAREVLDGFMVDGMPDSDAFDVNVGRVFDGILAGRSSRTVTRAYGEMVDLLWREGRSDAAIRLELLWNKLAATHSFALLCGYSMGNFYKQAEKFQEVCAQHTQMLDPDTNVVVFNRKTGTR